MKRYNPKELEPKIQGQWQKSDIYKAVDFSEKPKFVMLTEFPYPSGDGLHMGHTREYTLGDIIARRQRMAGHNVLYPMGYDSFGLPTENYAIKNKIAPQTATKDNIEYFQKQFDALGFSIDWSRSFSTTDPDYYKWTQWIFLQFYKKGLAYQDKIAINWCPKCKTGLANEEVVNGRHERCDTVVEKKTLKQWVLKITEYADRLISGLSTIDFPSKIADQQINWIGKSVGAEVDFKLDGQNETIKVFTTRPDTLFGVTYMVLAPEHELVNKITTDQQKKEVDKYVKESIAKSDIDRQVDQKDKTGVFTGAYAINPVNDKKIPIWIADYVLMGYGTGAIMAVPAHDERDFEFATKFDIKIINVIEPTQKFDGCYSGEGRIINSGIYNDMNSGDMREKIVADLAQKGVAKEKTQYKLRDWIFSRQHYWGEPIPIIHCNKCGAVPVPENLLPVTLPAVEHYEPTDTGESPLALVESWVNTTCPVCGELAKRETDTMPNWAGSSWYYLRYYDAKNNKQFAAKDKLNYWADADLYLGGMEHTTLHLLYSRFWHQFLYDQKLVPTPEPYKSRRGQGIILATDGSKMSKSKGNVINPLDIINQGYGADALRLAITFLAPYDQTTPWNSEAVAGTHRFLQRVWAITQRYIEADKKTDNVELEGELLTVSHKSIKKVSKDLETMSFNTAISVLMEFTNELYKIETKDGFASVKAWDFAIKTLLQLLAPFAPHITEELWQQIDQKESVHLSDWPVHDEAYLVESTVTIVIQVNGKLRGEIEMPHGSDQTAVETSAKMHQNVAEHLTGDVKKVIYINNKLINFVI